MTTLKNLCLLLMVILLVMAPTQLLAQTQQDIDNLARDVDRLESLRAVKNLQRSYLQYAQFGLWGGNGEPVFQHRDLHLGQGSREG